MLESTRDFYNSEVKYKSRLIKRRVKEHILGATSLAFVAIGTFWQTYVAEDMIYSVKAYQALDYMDKKTNNQLLLHPNLGNDLLIATLSYLSAGLLAVSSYERKRGAASVYRQRFEQKWLETADWSIANDLQMHQSVKSDIPVCKKHHLQTVIATKPLNINKNPYQISEN